MFRELPSLQLPGNLLKLLSTDQEAADRAMVLQCRLCLRIKSAGAIEVPEPLVTVAEDKRGYTRRSVVSSSVEPSGMQSHGRLTLSLP